MAHNTTLAIAEVAEVAAVRCILPTSGLRINLVFLWVLRNLL